MDEEQIIQEKTVSEETTNNSDKSEPSQDIQNINSNVGVSVYDGTPEAKEHTRSKMAQLFIIGFFALLFLCFVYAISVNATINDLKDLLVAMIGALSGTLGFIIGYYYKSFSEK